MKLRVYLSALSLIFFFWGCSSSTDSQSIPFFNGYSFALDSKEELMEPTTDIIKAHDSLLNYHEKLQVPLYKYVNHPDYKLFVDIPLNTTPEALANKLAADHPALRQKQKGTAYLLKFERNGQFIINYLRQIDEGAMVSLSFVSAQALDSAMFRHAYFDGRIKQD